MKIEDAISQLGKKMGIELKLDDNRACRLVFDDALKVDLEAPEALTGKLLMSCVVAAEIGPEGREKVLRTLLEANLCGRGTGGAVLALNDESEEVVLQRIVEMRHADLQDVEAALEQLLQYGEAWSARLASSRPEASGAPSVNAPSASAYMLKI